jgi:hypothetical protein
MTSKVLRLAATACSTLLIVACSDHNRTTAPMPPAAQTLDTAQVLVLAKSTSESAEPFQVDYGLVHFSDTSETSAPIAVDGN